MSISYVGESHDYAGYNIQMNLTPHASSGTGDFVLVWAWGTDSSPGLQVPLCGKDQTKLWPVAGGVAYTSQWGTYWYHHFLENGESGAHGFNNVRGGWQLGQMMTFRGVDAWRHGSDSGGTTSFGASSSGTWSVSSTAHTLGAGDHLLVYVVSMKCQLTSTPHLSVTPDAALTTIVDADISSTQRLYVGYEVVNGTGNFPARSISFASGAGSGTTMISYERIHSSGAENESGYDNGPPSGGAVESWAIA